MINFIFGAVAIATLTTLYQLVCRSEENER